MTQDTFYLKLKKSIPESDDSYILVIMRYTMTMSLETVIRQT